MSNELALKVENVKKRYRLGVIGGGTLQGDLQSWWARIRGKEDPNTKIGTNIDTKKGTFMALNGINFTVKKGDRLGIIGGNGAGKSTTLKILSRVTAPTEGTVYINGRISSMLEVGTGFHPELTGRENIYLNGAILGMSKEEVDQKMEDIIEFSECRQFIDTPVKRYSSGMYVKLAFAVAAHLDSEILIMDEVLAVGDMKFQQKCLKKMTSLAEEEGRTILYVSHNMATISQLCNRCLVLQKGEVIYDGDTSEAIKIYLDNGIDSEVYRDYTEYKRPEWLRANDMRIETACFAGKESNTFIDQEKIRLKFTWKNNKDITNLCMRWEILTEEEGSVGTALAEEFYSGTAGEKAEIELEFDLPGIVPGNYNSFITFYYRDEYGNNMNVDCVPGLAFTKELINEQQIKWDDRHWGYVRFPDAKWE